MLRIITVFSLLVSLHISVQAQHFDPLYNYFGEEPIAKTWEDSGWYFVPTLIEFIVQDITMGPSNVTGIDILFRSTDMSSLMFTGQGALFYRSDDLPPGLEIQPGTTGYAIILLPQSILFCPSPEQEQGLGQEEDAFPLSSIGKLNRIGPNILPSPITVLVQLNDFTAN